MTTYYSSYPTEAPITPPPSTYYDQAAIVPLNVSYEPEDYVHAESSYQGAVQNRPYLSPSTTSAFKLRPTSDYIQTPPTQVQQYSNPHKGKGKMDMNMAETGSLAATAGINTPLAQYAAQMVVWLWFGAPQPTSASASPLASGSPIPNDPFRVPKYPSTPLNPLQLHPTPEFTQFVSNLLKITMVSHSVTLLALLYTHRLKLRNPIQPGPGTEYRPFIASLILSNKYLDDNTYTNKTWAELTGVPVAEITQMEGEFLYGLDYDLSVEQSEYLQWRHMLDGFIMSRDNMRRSSNPHSTTYASSQENLLPYTSMPSADISMYRARSASPPAYSPPKHYRPYHHHGQHLPSPGHARKRSAIDAFSKEPTLPSSIYESLRRPVRKTGFATPVQPLYPPIQSNSGPIHLPPPPSLPNPTPSSTLSRSSSFNRRIARLPGDQGGRRGSLGQILPALTPDSGLGSADLRHQAANHSMEISQAHAQAQAQAQAWGRRSMEYTGTEYDGYNSLTAPYDRQSQSQLVPPEHLMFYTLAAEAHRGPDGAPRKAILCYQNPGQTNHGDGYYYPPPHQVATAMPIAQDGTTAYYPGNPDTDMSPVVYPYNGAAYSPVGYTHPNLQLQQHQQQEGYIPTQEVRHPEHAFAEGYAEAEPAQFANAGPPGYAYDPHYQRWSTGSEEMLVNNNNRYYNHHSQQQGVYRNEPPMSANTWRPRSEWSSPMPGYGGNTWRA